MEYILDCLKRFSALPAPLRQAVGGRDKLKKIEELEKKYATDIKFAVVLVMIGEIGSDDVAGYLAAKQKIGKVQAEEIAKRLDVEIFLPVRDYLDGLETPEAVEPDFDFSKIEADAGSVKKGGNTLYVLDNQEANGEVDIADEHELREIFKSYLFEALSAGVEERRKLNESIMIVLSADSDLKEDELVRLIAANQQTLTKKKFVLNGKQTFATIENWLKDFIGIHGTGDFDNMTLSNYLSNSANGKELEFSESQLVSRLINLYRNIKFFPESFESFPVEEWQFIPLHDKTELTSKARTTSGPPKTVDEALAHFEREAEVYPEGSLERKAILEEKRKYEKRFAAIKGNSSSTGLPA